VTGRVSAVGNRREFIGYRAKLFV